MTPLLEIVKRVEAGDKEAFNHLVELYWDVLVKYASKLVFDKHLAEDLVQQSMMTAFRRIKLTRCKSDASIYGWFKTNIWHHFLSNKRKKSESFVYRQRIYKADIEEDVTHTREASLKRYRRLHQKDKLSDAVQGLLKCLIKEERTVVVLHYWEGLSVEEIAQQLGVSKNHVSHRLTEAHKRIREFAKEEHNPLADCRYTVKVLPKHELKKRNIREYMEKHNLRRSLAYHAKKREMESVAV